MADFEWELADALNQFFDREEIKAIAYRLKQSRYTSQVVDLLVDSIHPRYYLAIECKSLDARKAKTLYFSQHFSKARGAHQVDRAEEFISISGRRGILAVELRRGAGNPKCAHLVPWDVVINCFRSEVPGLSIEQIETYPCLARSGRSYLIEGDELKDAVSGLGPYP